VSGSRWPAPSSGLATATARPGRPAPMLWAPTPTGCWSLLARAGAAIHSVRAVPLDQMHPVIAWAQRIGAPLHAHLSEQPAENEACLAAYRRNARRASL